MKVSDYVSQFLADSGIKDLFLISGGGIMHLLDSVAKQQGLDLVFNLNEQASGICADSYAQYTRRLGACLLTTGPGATNAVTGCAGAWLDSSPVIFISGQVKTSDLGQVRGLRQYGAQEIAIVPVVAPITKYAATVMKKEDIKYHMQKALYLATHGRKGPVWVDVPLDIQGSQVEVESLREFDPYAENLCEKDTVEDAAAGETYRLLNASQRPLLLIGHGVIGAEAEDMARELAREFQIPVVATWRAKGVFGDEDPLYMGSPGAPAVRYANYALQNSDLLIILGSRLNAAITAYDEPGFAPDAKKIIVDIEELEIDKLDMRFELKVVANIRHYLKKVLENKILYQYKKRTEWLEYCTKIKKKYPLRGERQPFDMEGKADGYYFAEKLSCYSTKDDVFVGSSSGRTCGISHMAYSLKEGQKFVTSMGIGSMGWCIPSAIACCIASGKKRTLVIEGDGSLQHNIQELALINNYKLPLKIFIYANDGYASIYTMQKNNFHSNFAGCNRQSGLGFPEIRKTAAAYGLPYYCIHNDQEVEKILSEVMDEENKRGCICEIKGSIRFDEIPKSITTANDDGTFSSCKLENLFPFLEKQEQSENMPRWDEPC